MESLEYSFSLLSETFSHGAYQTQNFNHPELRAPSVKGMIRWWHQALGLPADDQLLIFGHVADRRNGILNNHASAVSFRVDPVTEILQQEVDFMPHKGHRSGRKMALMPETGYRLMITQRREPLSADRWAQLQRAVETWLLLGAVGQRSTRGAGSILWDHAPSSKSDFEASVSELLAGAGVRVRVAILDVCGDSPTELRDLAGRFPKSSDYDIPGDVFGTARPRKPSPLKLRIVRIDGKLSLAAIWIPSNQREDTAMNLKAGVRVMAGIPAKQKLARLLEDALPILTANG